MDLVASGAVPREVYIEMQFYAYDRADLITGGTLNKASPLIVLPMPQSVVEQQVEQWVESTGTTAQKVLDGATVGGSLGVTKGLLAKFGDKAGSVTGVGEAASLYSAKISNPMLTLLYQGQTLKRHTLSWVLAPANAAETTRLQTIVNYIKLGQLPDEWGGPTGWLGYPSVLIPQYVPNKFLYNFMPCVVDSVTVNYSGAGTPSFFVGTGGPTIVTLTLTLIELTAWTKVNFMSGMSVDGVSAVPVGLEGIK